MEKTFDELIIILKKSILFQNMSDDQIKSCLESDYISMKSYQKNEVIFSQESQPEALYILLEGNVSIISYSFDGKRNLMTTIHEKGDLFGEVYLFLKQDYAFDALASKKSFVINISKQFFFAFSNDKIHQSIIQNMLEILASKAFLLSQKLRMVSYTSIRQKVVRYLISSKEGSEQKIILGLNRNELAEYLGISRPSLSRELIRMKEEKLIDIEGNTILFLQEENLLKYI